MGNIISGRYGSVQRLLPQSVSDDGKTTWHELDSDYDIRQNANNNGQGRRDHIVSAAKMTDDGGLLDTGTGDHYSTVSAVTSWSLENTMQPITYIASNTRGYQGKLEGTHNASGNIAGIGAVPPIAPGQRFRFYGYVGPANGKEDNYRGVVYRITAIANSVQIQINYQLTNPITWTVGWLSDWKEVGDELWCNQYSSLYANAGFWDNTNLDCSALLPSSENCLSIEGIQNPVCLLDANIQFQTETSQFTNSCSSAVGGWQSCVVGPTSCTVSANIHGDNYGDLYHAGKVEEYYSDGTNNQAHRLNRKFWSGSEHAVKIAVGQQSFWEFYKLMFTSFGGLKVDVTSNNPVQFSCNMEFNAYPKVGGKCEPGYIAFCDGSTCVPLVDLRTGTNKTYGQTYQTYEQSCPSTQDQSEGQSGGF